MGNLDENNNGKLLVRNQWHCKVCLMEIDGIFNGESVCAVSTM